MTQDTTEANQFLRGQVGLPPRTSFEQLFCLQAAQLPSRRPRARAGGPRSQSSPGVPSSRAHSSPGMPAPGLAAGQAVQPAQDLPAAEAKQRELEKELVLCREVDNLQFELDGLNSQVFSLESKLKSTEPLQEKVREAEARWSAEPTPEKLGLPADILARAERYARTLARRDEAMQRLLDEKDLADEEAKRTPDVEPLVKNRNFWLAVAAGIVCFGASLFFTNSVRYLALVDVPAFGVAAMFALRHVEELQHKDKLSRRGEQFAVREKKIADEFEAEAGPVRRALEVFDVDTPKEIAPRLQRREQLGAELAELRTQLLTQQKHPDYIDAGTQLPVIRQQIELLAAKVEQKGTFVRDLREVERELSRLKESIALARSPQSMGMGLPVGDPGGAAEGVEDPSPVLLGMRRTCWPRTCSPPRG